MSEPEIQVTVADGWGRIRLNRPRQINALTAAMLNTLTLVLDDFAADDRVRAIELTGAGDRGLCAGNDVRQLRQLVLDGGDPTECLGTEYALAVTLAGYPKPCLAVLDGITMGAGLGIAARASEVVVTPSSRLAMPETQIGLFPDVLMTWQLSRMPAEIGTHLALTGDAVNAADALWLKLADRSVGELPAPVLAADHAWIAECYSADDPVEIHDRLAAHDQPAAREAGAALAARCPLSVHVALAAVRRAATMTLAEVAAQDLRVCVALALRPDFIEGVRARLLDRDTPRWSHASLAEVTPAEVEAVFGG